MLHTTTSVNQGGCLGARDYMQTAQKRGNSLQKVGSSTRAIKDFSQVRKWPLKSAGEL